ncbi:MAG: 2OG-Fe(II) oxygenase [Gammaproteobacteria bacterium]|nr:2OG-Fe(II) oxygenase [Gammaproteobacteria bacterium]
MTAEPTRLSSVHFIDLDDAPAVNERLYQAFERENRVEDVRRTHSFHGRFENTYIKRERIPELAPVTQLAHACACRILGMERLHLGFWFNEMMPGQRTSLHAHQELDELLSAVYYIRCADDCGDLVLHDDPARVTVSPRPGLMVLFPPDLPHEVEENRSGQTRLSVAFNFGPWRSPT